jgi:hypothetical protein
MRLTRLRRALTRAGLGGHPGTVTQVAKMEQILERERMKDQLVNDHAHVLRMPTENRKAVLEAAARLGVSAMVLEREAIWRELRRLANAGIIPRSMVPKGPGRQEVGRPTESAPSPSRKAGTSSRGHA